MNMIFPPEPKWVLTKKSNSFILSYEDIEFKMYEDIDIYNENIDDEQYVEIPYFEEKYVEIDW